MPNIRLNKLQENIVCGILKHSEIKQNKSNDVIPIAAYR